MSKSGCRSNLSFLDDATCYVIERTRTHTHPEAGGVSHVWLGHMIDTLWENIYNRAL